MYHTPPLVAICKLQNLGKAQTHFFRALVPRLTSEVRRGTCLTEDDSQVYLHICLTYGPYQFSLTSVPYATAAENTWLWPVATSNSRKQINLPSSHNSFIVTNTSILKVAKVIQIRIHLSHRNEMK